MLTRLPVRQLLLVLSLALVFLCVVAICSLLPARASEALTCEVPSETYPTIQSAVDDAGCDAIAVAGGTFFERINIQRPVTISGAGAGVTTVDGIAGGSVFTIETTTVSLSELTITNGSAQEGGGIHNTGTALSIADCALEQNYASWHGGGLANVQGTLAVSDCTIAVNEADEGGGIFSESGTVEIVDSVLRDNVSGGHAGGFYNAQESVAVLNRVSIEDNTCHVDGGGLFNYGSMTIDNSSIHGNRSTDYSGGAIRNEGTLYVNNSTISGNQSGLGGAIDNWFGTLRLSNVTVSFNQGSPALDDTNGNVRIKNTIVSGNLGKDCRGTVRSDGYSLIGDSSGCDYKRGPGDILDVPANLDSLRGDPAFHPLRLGPAIDGGNPDGCTNHQGEVLETDQREMPRVGRCDMGAFEYQGAYHQAFLPSSSSLYCNPLFFDDFSDPDSGWYVGEDAFVLSAYREGEYQVRSKRSGYLYLFDAPACARDDYVVELDARWDSKPGMAYGLIFDITGDSDHYYLFAVNTEYQAFWLDYRSPDGWETLIEPVGSDEIKADRKTNHLKVIRDGDQLILEANGQVLRQESDSRVSGAGFVGLFTVSYNNQEDSDARFDNFSFRALP